MADRRPLKSRDTALAAKAARALAGYGVTPNAISQASMGFALLAGAAFWGAGFADEAVRWLLLILAALGCQLRLLCNLLDGMVAIEGGKGTPDGPYWNEAPDRIADALILAGMGMGALAPALGWAAAALAILVAYVRELGSAQGMAADFRGPMAKPHRMALATAAAVMAIFWADAVYWALWGILIGSGITFFWRSAALIAWLNRSE